MGCKCVVVGHGPRIRSEGEEWAEKWKPELRHLAGVLKKLVREVEYQTRELSGLREFRGFQSRD